MPIIIDTSSIIRLRKGQVFQYINQIFSEVYIPDAVFRECLDPLTVDAINSLNPKVVKVKNSLTIGLGAGEREAISLAKELKILSILMHTF